MTGSIIPENPNNSLAPIERSFGRLEFLPRETDDETNSASYRLACKRLQFGRSRICNDQKRLNVLYRVADRSQTKFVFELKSHGLQYIQLQFAHHYNEQRYDVFSLHFHLADLSGPIEIREHQIEGSTVVTFYNSNSPQVYRWRAAQGSHNAKAIWVRVAEISLTGNDNDLSMHPIRLTNERTPFEIGRCNTVSITFPRTPEFAIKFGTFLRDIVALNVKYQFMHDILEVHDLSLEKYKLLWSIYYTSPYELPFATQYLIAVALSSDCLDETQINDVMQLLQQIPVHIVNDLLSQVIFDQQRLGDARAYFADTHAKGGLHTKKIEQIVEYCVMLHKVIVTPTVMRVIPPNVEMSNRILRQYSSHADRFLRVQFLDEAGHGNIHGNGPEAALLFGRVSRTMSYGIEVAGRHYKFLAFGNSQLREHGAFFFATCNGPLDCGDKNCTGLSARKIREAIGDVSGIKIVAKQSSRLGQAFSTTRAMYDDNVRCTFVNIPEYIAGPGSRYSFSDGVGMVSAGILQDVARTMSEDRFRPCAIQFRLGGAKGVLVQANPAGVKLSNGSIHFVRENQICLRPSQRKFNSDHDKLEIVRVAKYGSSFLNRQSITTLWSLGVENDVFLRLQQEMIKELDLSLTDEKVALNCLRKYIDEHGGTIFLGELVQFGFMSRGDPFVQKVLRLFRLWSLKLLKEKAKVSVQHGCFLIGVTDDTRTLRGHFNYMYEQDETDIDRMELPEIFLQIPDPQNPTKLKVIEEVCIIGRAPTLHPGDLRLVRAVDRPELHYLSNVVVFPSTGDQDIPSMCAGGDLDGDDYTIIWDRSLLPTAGHRYVRCMAQQDSLPVVSEEISLQHIYDFMIDFMKNDSLPTIAHAHLAWAHDSKATMDGTNIEIRGAFSNECIELAHLHSTAVDFAKTGVAAQMPKRLVRQTFPDFMEKQGKPSFSSKTPLSLMYDQVKIKADEFIPNIQYDNTLCGVPGLLDWQNIAREIKAEYDSDVQRLMNQYGIKDEACIVTGFVINYSNHFSGQNEFKMRVDIAKQYNVIKDKYRSRIEHMSSHDLETGEELDLPSAERCKEAIVAAMYDVTFDVVAAQNMDIETAKLSFPWIFHEVLGRLSNQEKRRKRQAIMD